MEQNYGDNYPTIVADHAYKYFFSDNQRVASFLNYYYHDGKDIIKAKDIEDFNPDLALVGEWYNVYTQNGQRDILKIVTVGTKKAIVGIEVQKHYDSTMVKRDLNYDGMTYAKYKDDNKYYHLPVLTFIFYTNQKPWGPRRSLKKYLDYPELFDSTINDWTMPVVELINMDYQKIQPGDLCDLVELTQKIYSWNSTDEEIEKLISATKPNLATAAAIASIVDCSEMIRRDLFERKEKVNMCDSIKIYGDEKERKGKIEGRAEGKAEDLIKLLSKKFNKLSNKLVEFINSCNVEQLDIIIDNIFELESEDEVYSLFDIS